MSKVNIYDSSSFEDVNKKQGNQLIHNFSFYLKSLRSAVCETTTTVILVQFSVSAGSFGI